MAVVEERDRRSVAGPWLAGPLLLAVAAAAAAVVFAEGLGALAAAWSAPEYSHGPLIPVLSALMLLRQLRGVPQAPGAVPDRWPGVVVLALALALGLLSRASGIADVAAYGLIVWVGGVMLVSFGWRVGRELWPPVLHLAFMLPLPGLLYYELSTNLQFLSSEIGVALVRAAGVPAGLEGNVISLGGYQLHVAEACSGLRYLFPIMSFSYIFAVLYRGPTWHKAVLLLSAAPLAVLMNAARIGFIGVMVDRVGIEHAQGAAHLLEGWVVFLSCVALLFGLARLMLALQPRRMSLAEALDLDMTGLPEQLARLRHVRPSAALAAGAALYLATVAAWHAIPPRPTPVIEREPLAVFPLRLGAWSAGPPQTLAPEIRAALGADDYRLISFVSPGSPPVELFVAWYEDQTRGGIHSPEVCLPGGGWEMAAIAQVDLAAGAAGAEPFPVNRAVIQKGLDRLLVYYWFEQYGGRVAWDFAAKVALLRSGVAHGRTDGALIRLATPMRAGEAVEAAEARLRAVLEPAMAAMPRHVPRHSARHAPAPAPAAR